MIHILFRKLECASEKIFLNYFLKVSNTVMSENIEFSKMNAVDDLDNFSEVMEMENRLEQNEKRMAEEKIRVTMIGRENCI